MDDRIEIVLSYRDPENEMNRFNYGARITASQLARLFSLMDTMMEEGDIEEDDDTYSEYGEVDYS